MLLFSLCDGRWRWLIGFLQRRQSFIVLQHACHAFLLSRLLCFLVLVLFLLSYNTLWTCTTERGGVSEIDGATTAGRVDAWVRGGDSDGKDDGGGTPHSSSRNSNARAYGCPSSIPRDPRGDKREEGSSYGPSSSSTPLFPPSKGDRTPLYSTTNMAGVSIPYRPSHFVENRTGEEIIISHARPGDLVFLKDVTESVVTVRCCVAKVICEQCRNIRVVLTRTPVCQMVELIRCSGLVLRIGEYVGLQTFQVDLSHDCILEVLRPFFEGKIYCTDSPGTEIRLREAGEGGLTQHMVERPNNTAAGTQFVSRFQDGMLVSSVVQREGVGGYIVQDVL